MTSASGVDVDRRKQRDANNAPVWEEDVVSDPITPLPIDWAAWRAERLQQTKPDTKAA
jgi:hypothetical protein